MARRTHVRTQGCSELCVALGADLGETETRIEREEGVVWGTKKRMVADNGETDGF